MWPELSSHSVAYLRTRRWKQGLQEEWQCQSSGRSFEQHLWAALVVQTRALSCAQHLLLCPGLDLSNHVSVGPTARVKVEQDRVLLLSEYALDAGQEVTMSYYPEADYLDLFEARSIFWRAPRAREAYGFFDPTCVVHTVEVPLPLAALPGNCEEQAARGYDPVMEAWWLPDFNVEACPLWQALRHCYGESNEWRVQALRALRGV